jgi:hypothetical protein
MRSVCVAGLHFTFNDITKLLLWRIYVASNYTTYLDLHVIRPIFLSDFNEIWGFSTDFYKSSQCQIA